MSDVTLKPIVVPRGWDGQRLHFALVFNFEIKAGASPALGATFPKWPDELGRLLPAAGHAGVLKVTVSPDGAAAQTVPVSRVTAFDGAQAKKAWSAIFGEGWRSRGPVASPAVSPLAAIFTGTQAPKKEDKSIGGASDNRGSDVAVNPRGGSDLRPTQRIESLELGNARSFVAAAETHTAALRSASRQELAKAKAVAFRNRDVLSQTIGARAVAAKASPAALVQLAAAAIDLEGVGADLVTAMHFAQAAGDDGARLQRSVDLARNRPAKAVSVTQVTQPGTGEILARLKQHPGAMRVLGLVVDCSARFMPGTTGLLTGKIAVDLGGPIADVTLYNVATQFELQLGPGKLPYFRAAERSDGAIDDAALTWRQFHLLPPSYFSLQQSDHARTLMRARQGAGSPSSAQRDAPVEDALTDAIIIQAEHGGSAAAAIQARLQRAQVVRNGTVGDTQKPTPATELLLHAEDLMSGVTFEVALGDANGVTGGWHSLCRRHLSVKNGDEKLFECDEEGYLSTSVTMSAPPLVGGVQTVTPGAPDPSNLDKYLLQIVEDAAYNTPSLAKASPAGYVVTAPRATPRTSADLVKAAVQNEPAAQPTQLRGIFRDVITGADLKANPPAVDGQPVTVDGHDRVHLTTGPQVDAKQPTLVESLFLSPLFTTGDLGDPELPQTGLQMFQADNKLRKERFQFAFDGAVTAFLNADGTVFTPKTPGPAAGWLGDAFSSFEAEGERRAYAQTASDLAAAQPLRQLSDAGRIAAVISDSLPQAALTPDHAVMQGGDVTLLPLPFARPGQSDHFTKLESPAAVYPLSFRFRGVVHSATPTAGDASSVDLRLVGFNETPDTPVLLCPVAAISDRAGHAVTLDSSAPNWVVVAVAGDGVLVRPGGAFAVVQLHVLGKASAISGDAATAKADPFLAWVPRVARIEQTLQPLRGPVTGVIGFDAAGKIKATAATPIRFVLASAPDDPNVQTGFTTVSWPDIAAKNPSKLPAKIILPVGLTTAAPIDDLIIAATGRVEDVFLWQNGTRSTTAETVLLVEAWNVLASGPIADENLSDAARAAKSSPHLDWIVTVATDDRGNVPVRFDATLAPKVTTRLFHPLDLRLPAGPAQQPLWIDAVCVAQAGQLRGVGWPSWIAAYAPKVAPATALTLTLLDLRTLPLQAFATDQGGELTGFFKLAGPRGAVTWGGPAAFVETRPLLKMLGEVVSTEIGPQDCVVHIAGLSNAAPWQAQLRCAPADRFGDITSEQVSRRAVDLQPGDCVFAAVRPDPQGWFEIIRAAADADAPVPPANAPPPPADAKDAIALAAGLYGRWTPATTSTPAMTRAVLAFGSVDYLPEMVTTPRGVSRTVWGPSPVAGAGSGPASNLLLAGRPLDTAILRCLPVAFAQTIIAHAAPVALLGGSSLPAVHAVASDALARWRGWWLTVPQPGASDAKRDDSPGGWPIRLTSAPSGRMLPLRTGRTYWIRGWRTDLAGNIGYDALDQQAQQALDQLQKSDAPACAKRMDHEFKRPDAPLAPVLAQPGKVLGKPDFSFVGYGLAIDPDTPSTQQPGTSSQSLSLVLVTNRKGEAVPPRQLPVDKDSKQEPLPLYYASGYLLPPPVDVETVMSAGEFDPDPAKIKGAAALEAHAEQVRSMIYQHEQFYDDQAFGRRAQAGLNYFPDPFATTAVLRVAETLPSALLQPTGAAGVAVQPGPWSAFERLSFFPKGNWPKGDVTSRIEVAAGAFGVGVNGQNAALRVPPARVALAQIVAIEPKAATAAIGGNAGLTLDIVHAVTGPLRQPQWLDLLGDPPRKAADTAQAFTGHLTVDVPSTGSAGFALSWSDLWDETVPALFGAARVRAQVVKGAIARVIIDDAGFGYGSEAVVGPIEAKTGKDAVLRPIVSNGKLTGVTIEAAGSGYPDGDMPLGIVRRPPLHTLAAAVAKVSGGRIVEVTLTEDARDNGYYARPPLVRFHDMKGTGFGATCRAIVINGRVAGFTVDSGGQDYSGDIMVGIYTDEAVIAEQPIADRASVVAATWQPWLFSFNHAFGDTRARHLYLVGEGHTRFRDEVADKTQEPMTTEPRRYELISTARPPKPEIAYLLPSFQPVRRVQDAPGHRIEQHDGMIRCYVYRPWNATGDEKLGVVVYAAEINTTLVKESPRYEGLIPAALRKYVSRWGFDPVWDDVATAPLTADDFTNAVDVVRYDDIAELAGGDQPPVGVALHDMHYSAHRDMWYADIAIRPPEQGMPFVQLALVRYQPSSVQGLSMSEVALADPIVLAGQRRLTLRRTSEGVQLEVGGNFDGVRAHSRKAQSLPQRKMIVELRRRSADLPADIEGDLAFGDGRRSGSSDSWELRRAEPSLFTGRIPLVSEVTKNAGGFYLAVKELEVFPTAASYRDRSGSTGTITAGQPTFERLVFYRRLKLTDLPGG